jgi:predicted PurR-regulated permease PerM
VAGTAGFPGDGFSPLARFLIVAAALAVVTLFLRLAAPLLAPILLALFLAIATTPLLDWLRRRGLPKWPSLAVVAFVLADIGSFLALVSTGALEGFRDSLPTLRDRVQALGTELGAWLEELGVAASSEAVPDIVTAPDVSAVVRVLLNNLGGTLGNLLLVLVLVMFMLAESGTLRTKLRAAFPIDAGGEARLAALVHGINRYVKIKVLTSLATAACIFVWLKLMGIQFAVLWTLLAFFFNFIPFVGNILMTVPAAVMALLQYDVQSALVVAAGYFVVNVVIGSVIEPKVLGKGLGISPLAVFIAMLVWGWVFGAVGVFLSVPLTMGVIAVLNAFPSSRPLALLLGPARREPAADVPVVDGAPDVLAQPPPDAGERSP